MNKSLKILIVDDIEDILDVLTFYIENTLGTVQIFKALNSEQAIQTINEHRDLDMVICDFNMPGGNGYRVFEHFRKNSDKKFLLHTSDTLDMHPEFKNAKNFSLLAKPADDELLNLFLKELKTSVLSTQDSAYSPVHLELLSKMGESPCAVFLKLGENHYIKISHEQHTFTQEELLKLEKKQTEIVYILKKDFKSFISQFKNRAYEIIDQIIDEKPLNSFQLAKASLEFLQEAKEQLGLTPEVQELTNKNIKMVMSLVERHPPLREVLDKWNAFHDHFYRDRCSLIALISTSLAKKLHWVSDMTSQKLAFAALLHNVSLNKEQANQENDLILACADKKNLEIPEIKSYSQHTIIGSEMMRNWPHCPPDVDIIILQHHEQPNGTGFPFKIESSRIAPLSALFIISQSLADFIINGKGQNTLQMWIEQNKDKFQTGEFRKVFDILSKSHLN
jgi:response regulator RpfG family c-di-GMP phosphodiesterase